MTPSTALRRRIRVHPVLSPTMAGKRIVNICRQIPESPGKVKLIKNEVLDGPEAMSDLIQSQTSRERQKPDINRSVLVSGDLVLIRHSIVRKIDERDR